MATIIQESDDPGLFRFITDRNLLAQYDALEMAVRVAISNKIEGISHDLLCHLNQVVTKYLSDAPGKYRQCPIYITNSNHTPPAHNEIFDLIQEGIQYIFDNWKRRSPIHLAAYSLWKINWTHPFIEGNGRTARAVSYYIICVGNGIWFPGQNIIPQQIRADRQPYYEPLRAADLALTDRNVIDVSVLEDYLSGLLTNQLT